MSQVLQVITTTAERSDAQRIATAAVAKNLAACVQIDGPIDSIFRWQGAVDEVQEWRLSIKTTTSAYADLESLITELHPYDQPEIIATPVTQGAKGYLDWVVNSVVAPEIKPSDSATNEDDASQND